MIETMKFYGRTVVAPTLLEGRELCELPYIYFMKFIRAWFAGNLAEKPLWVDKDDHEPFVNWWFEQDKEVLWQVVLKFYNWRGLISKEEVEVAKEGKQFFSVWDGLGMMAKFNNSAKQLKKAERQNKAQAKK